MYSVGVAGRAGGPSVPKYERLKPPSDAIAMPARAQSSGICARTLVAGYKVPRQVVVVDRVVRSPSGKPDYRWARARATEVSGAAGDAAPAGSAAAGPAPAG